MTFRSFRTLKVVVLAPKSTIAMNLSAPASGIWCVSSWQAFEAQTERDKAQTAQKDAERAQQAEKQERLRAARGELVARQNAYASDMNVVQHALEDGNYRLARRTLEKHRPAPGQEQGRRQPDRAGSHDDDRVRGHRASVPEQQGTLHGARSGGRQGCMPLSTV